MPVIKIAIRIFGVLLTLIGLIWMGQGSGYFPYPASSFMIDQSPWIWRGALVAIVGLAIVFAAQRISR